MPAPKFIYFFFIKSVFIFGFISIFFSSFNTTAQILNNEQDAFSQAKELNRPVFLVFSGSDWCVPCIRFQKEILSDSSFIKYADANLVILVAEFPQKKKLPHGAPGLRYSPYKRMFSNWSFDEIELMYYYYLRSDGLQAHFISTFFGIKAFSND